jgi:hypothetical protein
MLHTLDTPSSGPRFRVPRSLLSVQDERSPDVPGIEQRRFRVARQVLQTILPE